MRLAGTTALVTGATSGIGAAVLDRFVREGATVVFCGRNAATGAAFEEGLGDKAIFCQADVTREEDIVRLVDFAASRLGRIDCLVNNAAQAEATDLASTTVDQLGQSMWSVFGSVVLVLRAVAPVMAASGGGNVINLGSSAGHRGNSSPAIYSALKAGVTHLTRCLAMELAPRRIRMNTISPGAIVTPIFRNQFGLEDMPVERSLELIRDSLAAIVPVGRSGEPEDIAAAAVFLASPEASYITGHDLVVDGGLTAALTPFGRNGEKGRIGAIISEGRARQ